MRTVLGIFVGISLFVSTAFADGPKQQEQNQQEQEQQKCDPFQQEQCEIAPEEEILKDGFYWQCNAQGWHEGHWGGHVARGPFYRNVYNRAFFECRRFHVRCAVSCAQFYHP